MTESVVLAEYGQMVAAGEERQKTHEQEEINNNIRGNYIDRLGFNRERDQPTEPPNGSKSARTTRTNRFSMDTYNADSTMLSTLSNVKVTKDSTTPKEMQRTEI